MELVDLDEPTSFLDHVYLGCTQRECKPIEDILDQHRELTARIKNFCSSNLIISRV